MLDCSITLIETTGVETSSNYALIIIVKTSSCDFSLSFLNDNIEKQGGNENLVKIYISMSSNQELKSAINARLVQSGEKERLKEHLRLRLIECGWKDQLKLAAKEAIRERGLERVKLEDLVKDITPNGRASVPDSVKRELLVKIKEFLAQQQSF